MSEIHWIDRKKYPFESRYFAVSAGRMHYVDEGAGSPIVMVHGNPTWSFLYRNLIKRLRPQYRCVAADHIGFGLSDNPEDWSYRPEDHAQNLSALIDGLGLSDITFVLQDWGGPHRPILCYNSSGQGYPHHPYEYLGVAGEPRFPFCRIQYLHASVPFVIRDLENRSLWSMPRTVHEHIDTAPAVIRLMDQTLKVVIGLVRSGNPDTAKLLCKGLAFSGRGQNRHLKPILGQLSGSTGPIPEPPAVTIAIFGLS
ncbi:MAG: alpha/beta fold hydrolase [Desulfovermiculus sp.]|nr:alpha/beta fold hydrolase [Desulfovermiculus sp.]